MERNLQDLIHDAAQLPVRDRAALAGALLRSLEPESTSESEIEIEAAWATEIERRISEVDDGSVELIPWEKVRAELIAQINEG